MKTVAIDLGACIGKYTLPFSRTYDQVIAIEPHPDNAAHLREMFKDTENVEIIEAAVSNTNEPQKLHLHVRIRTVGTMASSLKVEKNNVLKDTFHTVTTIKLSELLKARGIERVAILKMDIEGSEYDVFEDLLDEEMMGTIDKIMYECHLDKVKGLAEASATTIERLKPWRARIADMGD